MDRSSSYSPSKIGSFGSDEQISGLNEQIPGPGQSYLSDIGPTVWERSVSYKRCSHTQSEGPNLV